CCGTTARTPAARPSPCSWQRATPSAAISCADGWAARRRLPPCLAPNRSPAWSTSRWRDPRAPSCPMPMIPRHRRTVAEQHPPTHHPEHPNTAHEHEHGLYEPAEFLDAPASEAIPEREVNLARRFLNVRTIGSIVFGVALLVLL